MRRGSIPLPLAPSPPAHNHRRKRGGVWVRTILCASLLLSIVSAADPPGKHHKHSLHDLRKQHAEKMAERKKLAAKKRLIEHKARAVRRDIHDIDQEISDRIAQIDQTEERLEQNQIQQKVLSRELDSDTQKLRVRSNQARMRLRQIYMHGNSSLASAIVGSKSLAEFASRKFVFERIAQRDRQLFEEVRELQQAVLRQKQKVDALVVQINKAIDDIKTEKAELQDARQEKADNLQDLKGQEAEIEQLIRELDEEDASVMSEIQQYEGTHVMGHFGGRFMIPVFGARLASGFGMRYHPILHRTRMHAGQDLAAPSGTPIHAAADGVVIACRYMHGYGNAIIVDHGGGYSTLYGHCSRLIASPGQHVSRGQTIALVGQTGLATGPHCHFEIRINGRPVNPMKYLR